MLNYHMLQHIAEDHGVLIQFLDPSRFGLPSYKLIIYRGAGLHVSRYVSLEELSEPSYLLEVLKRMYRELRFEEAMSTDE